MADPWFRMRGMQTQKWGHQCILCASVFEFPASVSYEGHCVEVNSQCPFPEHTEFTSAQCPARTLCGGKFTVSRLGVLRTLWIYLRTVSWNSNRGEKLKHRDESHTRAPSYYTADFFLKTAWKWKIRELWREEKIGQNNRLEDLDLPPPPPRLSPPLGNYGSATDHLLENANSAIL